MVRILTDSTTTVYYVNKQRRAHSRLFCLVAIDLWQLFIKEDLVAIHLLGVQNHLADQLSRIFSLTYKWSLKSCVLRIVFTTWDILTICNKGKHKVLPNRFLGRTQPRLPPRCLLLQLAVDSAIHLPSYYNNFPGPCQAQGGLSQTCPDHPGMAETGLILRSPQAVSLASHADSSLS